MTDPPVYNLDDSDDASTMARPTLPLPKHYTLINRFTQTMVSDSPQNNIEPFAATFDDPLVELNEMLTDALNQCQEMLDNLPRIKKDLLEINRNYKANTTKRASTMREFKEGRDQSCRTDCGYEGLSETAS